MATKKITVKAPTKRESTDAGKQTRAGHPSGARVLDEVKIAKNTKPKGKK